MRTILLTTLLLAATTLAGCTSEPSATPSNITEQILVRAGDGLEWKLHLDEGDEIDYEWFSSGHLFFDFHGEPDGAAPDEFTSHKLGDNDEDAGTLTAPFTGTHGWYWENQGDEDVQVTLTVRGTFDVVGFV